MDAREGLESATSDVAGPRTGESDGPATAAEIIEFDISPRRRRAATRLELILALALAVMLVVLAVTLAPRVL